MITLFQDFVKNPFKPLYLWILILVNFAGSIYGYYWYAGQLADTPWYYWPFTPDSPLSSTLFMITLFLFLAGKKPKLFPLLAYAGVIKYGIWAVIINVDLWFKISGFTADTVMLAVSHLGMAVEGMIYLRKLSVPTRNLWFLVFWLALNDWLDYGLGIHPYLFNDSQFGLALFSAVSLSLLILIYLKFIKNRL